jgi:hypothetical protein
MGLQSQWSNQSRGPDLNTQCTRVPHKSFPMLNAFHVSESTAGRCVLWPGRKYFGVPRKINVTYGLVLVLGNEQDQTMKQFLFRRLFARGKVCDHFNILILNWALRVFFLGYFFLFICCVCTCAHVFEFGADGATNHLSCGEKWSPNEIIKISGWVKGVFSSIRGCPSQLNGL